MKKSNVKVGEVSSLSRKETKKNKQNSNKKIRKESWKREWEIIIPVGNKDEQNTTAETLTSIQGNSSEYDQLFKKAEINIEEM